MAFDEPHRLQFHFTPTANWLNDPNGLVYYAGEYHLFYQCHPDSTLWGPMHWGHAVSRNLVNWTHLPIALFPDAIGAIFSGSAVIDWRNTAGFGAEAMVAIFTHDTPGRQIQSLAFSNDRGRSWHKYRDNPVLEPPDGAQDFRDPKVFWLDSGKGKGYWVMLVAAGHTVLFYTSADLKQWTSVSAFGFGHGCTAGVWETPDLFDLPVDDGPETRWLLSVGAGDGAPGGGSGTQYFIGDFDGETFTSDNPKETILWVDYGADFYAAQSWSDAPDGRRIWLAWMSNWAYAHQIPTSTWRGAMTIPREVGLIRTPAGIRMVQHPVAELARLRGKHWAWEQQPITPGYQRLRTRTGAPLTGDAWEIIAEFQLEDAPAEGRFGLHVRTGGDESTAIGYATKEQMLYVDRSHSGEVAFNPSFPAIHTVEMTPADGKVHLHIFMDRSSVEVFGNDGQVMMTERIFPGAKNLGIDIFADIKEIHLNFLHVHQLNTADFNAAEKD